MCDLREGTCHSESEVREVLLEEVTCKPRPEEKQMIKQRDHKWERMFPGEGTACVRTLGACGHCRQKAKN